MPQPIEIFNANHSPLSPWMLEQAAQMFNQSFWSDVILYVAEDILEQFTAELFGAAQAQVERYPGLRGEILFARRFDHVIVGHMTNIGITRPSVWGTERLELELRHASTRLANAAQRLNQQTAMIASFHAPYSFAYLAEWQLAISEAQGAVESYRVAKSRWDYDQTEKEAANAKRLDSNIVGVSSDRS